MSKMLEMFEDNDDVQNVWHNWETPTTQSKIKKDRAAIRQSVCKTDSVPTV